MRRRAESPILAERSLQERGSRLLPPARALAAAPHAGAHVPHAFPTSCPPTPKTRTLPDSIVSSLHESNPSGVRAVILVPRCAPRPA